tara:strand:+ start:2285 stop:2578 length:294 start_codon:yes stop_codon:yes gene_type:complete
MKNFKKIREEALRQQVRHEEVFKVGDQIMSAHTGDKGKIHRIGGNYVICISEYGDMFRAWIKDIRLLNLREDINKDRKSTIFFTHGKAKTSQQCSTR